MWLRYIAVVIGVAVFVVEGKTDACNTEKYRAKYAGLNITVPQGGARRRSYRGLARESMRFVTSDVGLTDSKYFCAKVGDTAPDFDGGSQTCATEAQVLTAAKVAVYKKAVAVSIRVLSEAISVDRLSANLVLGPNVCSGMGVPEMHRSDGVPNADLVLYLTAGFADETTLGWATGCAEDNNGRPIAGHVNMNPSHLEWKDGVADELQPVVETMTHEIIHALGFSGGFINSARFKQETPTTTATLRGKQVTILQTPEVKRVARDYLGCSTLEGVELEDGGSAGSAGSHWEKRVLANELMAASGGTQLSVFTLALLKDSGHYDVDYSKAMSMVWGKNAGCGYVTEKCNTVSGGKGKYWCFADAGSEVQCTADRSSIGSCAVTQYPTDLPYYYQYFLSSGKRGGADEFTDYCPRVQPYVNRQCTSSAFNPTDVRLGFYSGPDSRCVHTAGLIWERYTLAAGSDDGFRCLKTLCRITAGTTRVYFGLRNEVQRYVEIPCPEDGSAGVVVLEEYSTGYSGSLNCPAASDVCVPSLVVNTTVPPTLPPVPTDPTTPTQVPSLANVVPMVFLVLTNATNVTSTQSSSTLLEILNTTVLQESILVAVGTIRSTSVWLSGIDDVLIYTVTPNGTWFNVSVGFLEEDGRSTHEICQKLVAHLWVNSTFLPGFNVSNATWGLAIPPQSAPSVGLLDIPVPLLVVMAIVAVAAALVIVSLCFKPANKFREDRSIELTERFIKYAV